MRKLVVIGLFLVMILSPLLGSFLGIRSESKENRILADMPPISAGALFDRGIYPKIENFYNDHFAFRGRLIFAKNWIDYRIFKGSPSSQVHIGKDGWLFSTETIPSYLKIECGERENMRILAKQLHDLERVTRSSGKEFYFMIAPNKATIYPEHVGMEKPDTGCGKSRYDLLLEAFNEYPVNGFIRLDDIFIKAKAEHQLYYKTDTHWNVYGFTAASEALLKALNPASWKEYLPPAKTIKIEFDGELVRMLGLSILEDADFFEITKGNPVRTEETFPLANKRSYFRYTTATNTGGILLPRTFAYRDSFIQGVILRLAGSFKEFDAVWPDDFTTYNIPTNEKAETDDIRASQIVIIEVVERFLGHLNINPAKFEAMLKDTTRTQTQAQAQTGSAFSALLPPALVGKTIAARGQSNTEILNKKRIGNIVDVKSEEGFELIGWALDDKTKSAQEMVFIELAPVKGAKYYAVASRTERDDVVKAYNVPAYKNAGYLLKADIKPVPSGEYEINVIQIVDGNAILVSSGKKINKTN